MLDRLEAQSPDALLALIKLFAADERADKIDLGVGVYRTDEGATPVFTSIKQAEQRLIDEQPSKSYLGPEGDTAFVSGLMPYIFGRDNPDMDGRVGGMQTPGGTGAVRLAVALAKQAGAKRVHMGSPSWPNHVQILRDVGLEAVLFDHANEDGSANLDALIAVIKGAQDGDVVLLHACCHNPTGVDYSEAEWRLIADALAASDVLPIIDSAYHGLGAGMEEDVAGMRMVLAAVPEALVAYSCDKNFGLYRDRVGAFYVMARGGEQLDAIMSNANALARANWSMPPDHGGAAVRIILQDEALVADWQDEITTMRARLRTMREALAAADNRVSGLNLAPLADQNGLFAVLKLDADQIATMRSKHAVYMAGSGRINIAGLTSGNIEKFIDALADVAG